MSPSPPALLLAATLVAAPMLAQPIDGGWFTVDGGGTTAASAGLWSVGGTAGQADAGPVLAAGGYTLHGGYWSVATAVGLTVAATPDPATLPEPGGDLQVDVVIANTGSFPLTIEGLAGDALGDLDGQGSCALPMAVPPRGRYACAFPTTAAGNAGAIVGDRIVATGRGAELEVAAEGSFAVTLVDLPPAIDARLEPTPAAVVEPGGAVSYRVWVENPGAEALELVALADDLLGDLDGQGDCTLPQLLAPTGSYLCRFTAQVAGNAGATALRTVTATARDDEEGTAQATAVAAVDILDLPPAIALTATATPASVIEPGGDVTFALRVDNLGAETLDLVTLESDLDGDLDGVGDCATPARLTGGGSLTCSFVATVNGSFGDVETRVMRAVATDDEDGSADGLGTVSVAVASSDQTPPAVGAVSAAGVPLGACTTVTRPIALLAVAIVDNAHEIVGADELASHALIAAGADRAFDTEQCGPPAGDDVTVPFAALDVVAQDATSIDVALRLAAALEPGLYRLLVCDAITDLPGNALDGDGDGTAGGDRAITFRADPSNRFANGHFDCDLEAWTARPASGPVGHASDDSSGSPASGSARLDGPMAGDGLSLGQCVDLPGGLPLEIAGDLRVDALVQPVALVQGCDAFGRPGCLGEVIDQRLTVSVVPAASGTWARYVNGFSLPPATVSAFCFQGLATLDPGDPFTAHLDHLTLVADELIFADGFETGDTSAWSATTP